MKRDLTDAIKAWDKSGISRKPLILMGARQVGKSWLMKTFADECYPGDTVYVDLHDNEMLREAIDRTAADAMGLLEIIGVAAGRKITPGKTLLILDEIQESPKLLSSLKYFREKTPELAVMAAGSLLGLALNRGTSRGGGGAARVSFPVGKVNFLEVRPMTFGEFLDAVGEGMKRECLERGAWAAVDALHESYCELLKRYYFTGGMPEAVEAYSRERDFAAVRKVQEEILLAYDKDFAKHAPAALLPKIRLLWQAIPSQLARENKKFTYTALRAGARAREYEVALQWLEDAGMIRIVRRVARPGIPLKGYEDFSAFKLYAHDVGLLGAMSGLPQQAIISGNELFTHFKGALTEQYVLGELEAAGMHPSYWATDEGMAEVEFVVQGERGVYPVEVKAERNLQAKSLKSYLKRFSPERVFRASLARRGAGNGIEDVPLYAIGGIFRGVEQTAEAR